MNASGNHLQLLVGQFIILTLFGTGLVSASARLYNAFVGGAGSPASVPQPNLAKCLAVAVVLTAISLVIPLAFPFVLGSFGGGKSQDPLLEMAALFAIVFPIFFGCMTAMLTAMLPTSIGRAALVALCYHLLGLIIALVLAGGISLLQ